jgi:hypothetical protein
MESFARTLGIRRGNDRRVQVNKSPFLEKLVNGKSQGIPYAENGTESICPESQVGMFSQKLKAWAVF